jgi:Fur family transcriptional regulator, peroxide stress response regulator
MDKLIIKNKLIEQGLKVTPQRMSVLEAIYTLDTHPTVEHIIEKIRPTYPNIATATVYKVLDVLVANGLIKRVMTEKDVMRYDGVVENHHHLYCISCDYIDDYENAELDLLLKKFFEKNKIDNFQIENIQLQINGSFIKHKNMNHIDKINK